MINKALFGLKPFEILEAIRKDVEKLPVSEELKELEIESVRKLLAHGPFLKPGRGFSTFEEEPIPLKELLGRFSNHPLAIHFSRKELLKETILVDWNEEELLLAEELIESGTYLFKTSQEGIVIKKVS